MGEGHVARVGIRMYWTGQETLVREPSFLKGEFNCGKVLNWNSRTLFNPLDRRRIDLK